ncbi:MAG: hypothetical protein ABI847_06135, partial [Anaerolineales bacterium]
DQMVDIQAQVAALHRPDCAAGAHAAVLAYLKADLKLAKFLAAGRRPPVGQAITLREFARSMAKQLNQFRVLAGLSA